MGLFSNLRPGVTSSKAFASPPLPPAPSSSSSQPADPPPQPTSSKRLSAKKPVKQRQRPPSRRSGNNNKSGFPTSSQMIQGLGLRRSTSRSSHSSGSSFSCHGNGLDGGGWGLSDDEDNGRYSASWDPTAEAAMLAGRFNSYHAPAGEDDDGGREEIVDLTVSQLGGPQQARAVSTTSAYSQSTTSSFSFCATRPPSQFTTAGYTPGSSQSSGSTPSNSSEASSVQTPTVDSPHRGEGGAYDWSFPYSTVSPIRTLHHEHEEGSSSSLVAPFGQDNRFAAESSSSKQPPVRQARARASSRPTPPDPSLITQRNRSTSGASATTMASSTSSFYVPSASIASSRRPSRVVSGGEASKSAAPKMMKPLPPPPPPPLTAGDDRPVTPESSPATPTVGAGPQLSPAATIDEDLDRSFGSVVGLYGQLSRGSSAAPEDDVGVQTPLEPVWDAFLREADISPVQEAIDELPAVDPAEAPRRPLPPPPPPVLVDPPSSSDDETSSAVHAISGPSTTAPLKLPAILPLRIHTPPMPSHASTSSISSVCSIPDLPAHLAALKFPRPPPVSHLPSRLRSIIPSAAPCLPPSMPAADSVPSPSTNSFRSRLSNGSSTTCDSPSPLTPSFPPPMPEDALVSAYHSTTTASGAGEDDLTATLGRPGAAGDDSDAVDLEALARIKWSSAAARADDGEVVDDPEQTIRVKAGRKRRGLIGEAV